MLFDSFKADMVYKYGYDSNADSSEEKMESDKEESTICDICGRSSKIRLTADEITDDILAKANLTRFIIIIIDHFYSRWYFFQNKCFPRWYLF